MKIQIEAKVSGPDFPMSITKYCIFLLNVNFHIPRIEEHCTGPPSQQALDGLQPWPRRAGSRCLSTSSASYAHEAGKGACSWSCLHASSCHRLHVLTPSASDCTAVSRRLPAAADGFKAGSRLVGFMEDKAALGQVSSQYFCFPCQAFRRLLHTFHHPYNRPNSGLGSTAPQKEERTQRIEIQPILVHMRCI
jgi:hypothetical protein